MYIYTHTHACEYICSDELFFQNRMGAYNFAVM